MNTIFDVRELCKVNNLWQAHSEGENGFKKHIIQNLSFKISSGEFVLFYGKNSSGKSALFKMLIAEEQPDSGHIFYMDKDISKFSRKELKEYRKNLGLVFQDLKLIDRKSVKDNVAIIPFSHGVEPQEVWKRTYGILKNMNLLEYQKCYPADLSAGTRQRLAIARALVNDPPVIIADEPTSSVDTEMEKESFEIFSRRNDTGKTVIVFTSKKNIADSLETRIIEI